MLVSPRHDSPILSQPCQWCICQLRASSNIDWPYMDASLGKIRYTNICHILVVTYINACQSPAWLSYTIAAMPMMHLSAESMIPFRLIVDGCIPGQDMIYHHLSCWCYHSYQCLSVPDMTLLSYPILSQPSQANDASVSWEHDPPILIDCRWMHPWAR